MTDQWIKSLRAAVLACILTAALVLLLTLLLRWNIFSESGLNALIVCIKALSACLAGYLHYDPAIRRLWLIAGLSGMLYMLLSLVVFSLLSGEFALRFSYVSDMLMGFACASCACILRSILKKETGAKR